MEAKTLKQSLRDFFSFKWLARKPNVRSSSYGRPYYGYRPKKDWTMWQLGSIILIALLMATCAGVDAWKGDIGQSRGRVEDLYSRHDFDDNSTDYYVTISWSGNSSTHTVTRSTWKALSKGDPCTVHYVVGGLTGMTWTYDIKYGN